MLNASTLQQNLIKKTNHSLTTKNLTNTKMKNITHSLKSGFQRFSVLSFTLFLMAVAFLPSCDNSKSKDTEEVAEDQNEAKFDRPKENDAEFLVAAAAINLEQIKLGQLAQLRGTMADVKELGKSMESGHTKALNELKTLAAQKQITIPTSLTEDGQDAENKLTKQSGKDFDKDYCDRMVNGHKDAIDKFENVSTEANDEDIRNWASSVLPDIRAHLNHSRICQEKCSKM